MERLVRDIKIHYEVYGAGMPIVMIHGWGPDLRLMKGCMEPVFRTSETKWRRIYFDLPGMGKTEGKPWITDADRMLDLILEFIDAVVPERHFALAGESYGGYLAQGIVRRRHADVDGLLLICPSMMQDAKEAQYRVFEKDDALLAGLCTEDRSYFEAEGICVLHNERVWKRYRQEVLPGLKIADPSFLRNYGKHAAFRVPVDPTEAPFQKPALLFAGRQDSIVGYRHLWQLVQAYPRASFLLLDRAGHALQIEQDVLFTNAVGEWLNRVAAEPG